VNIPQGKTDTLSLDLYMVFHIEISIEYNPIWIVCIGDTILSIVSPIDEP
jgi:hypothetical protein